jgi:hypothetical protein
LKLKLMLAIAGVAALAINSGTATAGNGDKVTGGGQILVGENAGSTIAFTAQGTTTDAKGQVQFIDRTEGPQGQLKFHGVVDCVEVTDNFAVVGGLTKQGEDFTLRVVDNGEPNQGMDMVQFDRDSDFQCGDNKDDDPPSMALGRGNAKVRDGNESNPPQQSSNSSLSALSVIGF